MTITPDWPTIIGGALVALGIGGTTIPRLLDWWKKRQPSTEFGIIMPQPNLEKESRKSDDKPPAGAVAWVLDIADSMGGASAESVLFALRTGYTRDEARQMRITELEAGKKPVEKGAKP
jgi:hypothetical protein